MSIEGQARRSVCLRYGKKPKGWQEEDKQTNELLRAVSIWFVRRIRPPIYFFCNQMTYDVAHVLPSSIRRPQFVGPEIRLRHHSPVWSSEAGYCHLASLKQFLDTCSLTDHVALVDLRRKAVWVSVRCVSAGVMHVLGRSTLGIWRLHKASCSKNRFAWLAIFC